MADFLMNLNTHTLAQFLASSANSEAAAKEELANLDRWIDEADKRCADLTEQLQFEKRRLVELRDRKRLAEVDLANAQAATTVISNELGGRQRRKAELNRINRKRVGLPPFAKIPVKEKEGEQAGWVELETIVHIDGEALKEGAVVSMVRKHQESKAKRVCGNCVRRIETPEYPYGWCTWGGFPATVNGAGPEHCGNFDPLPLPSTPPAEAVAALDHLLTPEEFDPNDPRR